MAAAKSGDTVKVNYTGKLDDGTVFDTSEGREPLEFTVGSGQVIPDFDEAVIGMECGASKIIKTVSERAYGPYHEELVTKLGREVLPPNVEIEVGMMLHMRSNDGQVMAVTVKELTEDSITLDANHPLAGKDLTFEIGLVEIV